MKLTNRLTNNFYINLYKIRLKPILAFLNILFLLYVILKKKKI